MKVNPITPSFMKNPNGIFYYVRSTPNSSVWSNNKRDLIEERLDRDGCEVRMKYAPNRPHRFGSFDNAIDFVVAKRRVQDDG